jgi:protein associated with RNAse G/E
VVSTPQIITVNSRAFDGSTRRSWTASLEYLDLPFIKLVGSFESAVEHSELGSIESGTISYEYFWTDRWHNIFRLHQPDGDFRNYYINLSMPPTFSDGILNYVDLDIDIVVWSDGSFQVLDIEEFEASAERFSYSDELRRRVEDELDSMLKTIRAGGLSRLDP